MLLAQPRGMMRATFTSRAAPPRLSGAVRASGASATTQQQQQRGCGAVHEGASCAETVGPLGRWGSAAPAAALASALLLLVVSPGPAPAASLTSAPELTGSAPLFPSASSVLAEILPIKPAPSLLDKTTLPSTKPGVVAVPTSGETVSRTVPPVFAPNKCSSEPCSAAKLIQKLDPSQGDIEVIAPAEAAVNPAPPAPLEAEPTQPKDKGKGRFAAMSSSQAAYSIGAIAAPASKPDAVAAVDTVSRNVPTAPIKGTPEPNSAAELIQKLDPSQAAVEVIAPVGDALKGVGPNAAKAFAPANAAIKEATAPARDALKDAVDASGKAFAPLGAAIKDAAYAMPGLPRTQDAAAPVQAAFKEAEAATAPTRDAIAKDAKGALEDARDAVMPAGNAIKDAAAASGKAIKDVADTKPGLPKTEPAPTQATTQATSQGPQWLSNILGNRK